MPEAGRTPSTTCCPATANLQQTWSSLEISQQIFPESIDATLRSHYCLQQPYLSNRRGSGRGWTGKNRSEGHKTTAAAQAAKAVNLARQRRQDSCRTRANRSDDPKNVIVFRPGNPGDFPPGTACRNVAFSKHAVRGTARLPEHQGRTNGFLTDVMKISNISRRHGLGSRFAIRALKTDQPVGGIVPDGHDLPDQRSAAGVGATSLFARPARPDRRVLPGPPGRGAACRERHLKCCFRSGQNLFRQDFLSQ